jgi:hypothetical protein
VAPLAGEKKPAWHGSQASEPLAGCALPGAQGMQEPPTQKVPGGHSAQDSVAGTAYAPLGQVAFSGRQEAPSSALRRSAPQGRHRLLSAAPTATLYFPGAHRVQSAREEAPGMALKRPAGQARQVVSPGAA